MCLWILSLWIALHFLFIVISMDPNNDTVKSQSQRSFEKITKQNIIKMLNRNSTIDKNEPNTMTNAFLVNGTETREESANLSFPTKLSLDILKLNKTNQDYSKTTSYRRNKNKIQTIDLFLHNKSQTRLTITPYHAAQKYKKLDVNINKEIQNNITKDDNDNTREHRVKFGGKEYVLSKTDRDSIVRAMVPKIERYRLGSFHFSHEMEILNAKSKKNLRVTAMIIDSHESLTPDPFVFEQNNHIDNVDYKLPEEIFENTTTKPIEYFLTSPVVLILTTEKEIKSFRKELHQERILMKMGPFTFFTYKLMELLAGIRPNQLAKELTDQFLNVSLELYNERPNLFEFGQPFNRGVIDFFTSIQAYEADTLERMAAVFHKALPKRWELFHVLVNVLYERIDQLYLQSEVNTLYNLLEDLRNYPNIGKNATQFARSLLVDAVVNPFTREGRTQRRLDMLMRLNAYVSFAFYNRQFLSLPGFDEGADPPTPVMIVTPPAGIVISTQSVEHVFEYYDALEAKKNVTQDIKTANMTNATQGLEETRMTTVTQGSGTTSVTTDTQGLEITVKSTDVTKEFGRSGKKSSTEQESDVILSDEEDIILKNLYRGFIASGKSKFHEDGILSSYKKYFSNRQPLNHSTVYKKSMSVYIDHPKTKVNTQSYPRKLKYVSDALTTKSLKENTKKSRNKIFKQKIPPSNYAKKISKNYKFNREDKERSLLFITDGDYPNSSVAGKSYREQANLGKLWKEVLETDKSLDKKGLYKKQTKKYTKITASTSIPKLEAEEFKYETKSYTQSGLVTTDKLQNILRNKIENNDDITVIKRSSVTQGQIKSTDSFLDLLRKLDELVNSGERGLLDEILNSDDKLRDSTFQKIDAENEKFLEKEAAAKITRKAPKLHTKEHTQNKWENTDKSKRLNRSKNEKKNHTKEHVLDKLGNGIKSTKLDLGKVHEKIKSVKGRVHDILKNTSRKDYKTNKYTVTKHKLHSSDPLKSHKFQQYTRESTRSIKDHYIKHPSRGEYNNNNSHSPLKEEVMSEYDKKKKSAYREKTHHKTEKSVQVMNKNHTKIEFYPQTQMNYFYEENSRETTNSHTFIKLNLKAVMPDTTRKLSIKYTNDYVTKKALRGLKIDHTMKKSSEKKAKDYVINITSKEFEKDFKTTSKLEKIIKERVTRKPMKYYKKNYRSKSLPDKKTKYHTNIKLWNEPAKHNLSVKKIKKVSIQNTLNPIARLYSTKRYSKSESQTKNNVEEVFQNTKNHPYTIKHKHYLQKHQGYKINKRITEDTQDDNNYSSDNHKKILNENVVSSIEDVSTYHKKAATRYRPSERMNKEFLSKRKEKKKKIKRKHSKIYRPLERVAGKEKHSKKVRMQNKLKKQQRKSHVRFEEYGDKPSEDNGIINEELDSSIVWNPTNSMEKAAKQNSDDYYIVQGGEKTKIIFQDDEKRYELKKTNKGPLGNNTNMASEGNKRNLFVLNEKDNYSAVPNKLKVDHNLRKRNKNKIDNKKIMNNLKQREIYKGHTNKEKNDLSELTDLLDDIFDQNSSDRAVPKNIYEYKDDFDAPINEYTLKPLHKFSTERLVFTTRDIFDELKHLKNRLFHQNFRRNMNRKHKITFNELFFKKRSRLKKIIEESSYSDDEKDLKAKLKDALLHGRAQNTTEMVKKIENKNKFKKR